MGEHVKAAIAAALRKIDRLGIFLNYLTPDAETVEEQHRRMMAERAAAKALR